MSCIPPPAGFEPVTLRSEVVSANHSAPADSSQKITRSFGLQGYKGSTTAPIVDKRYEISFFPHWPLSILPNINYD